MPHDPHNPQEFQMAASGVEISTLSHLKPILWSDIASLQPLETLIKGVLNRGAMSVIYGESGCGKTFFTLDLSLHIASGEPWNGHRVRQGAVIYIASEGGLGIATRLRAVEMARNIDPSGQPFAVIPSSLDLCDPQADTGPLIAEILALSRDLERVELVVIDTLSRVMAGRNENGSEDMTALIANIDRIRVETGAHVALVHHSGKDSARGARGHSALRAATDTEIEVVKDAVSGVITATVQKQRDGLAGTAFSFMLKSVDVGTDADGDPITSCIVEPSEAAKRSPRLTARERSALAQFDEALLECAQPAPDAKHYPAGVNVVPTDLWRERLFACGVLDRDAANPREPFRRIKNGLRDKGIIAEWNSLAWRVPAS